MRQSKHSPDAETAWLSPRDGQNLLNVSESYFYKRIVPGLSDSETRKLGGRRLLKATGLVRVHVERIAERLRPTETDPLLVEAGGAKSPALEAYRHERMLLARMEREEKQGELIPRDLIRQCLTLVANLIREAGEILRRDFGTAAADVLNRALDDGEREISRLFGDDHKPRKEQLTNAH